MKTSTVTMKGEREIHVERIFDAPRERVWRAMTEAELLSQWWGRGNKLVVERLELERGGRWRFVEHTDHGVFGFEGEFREVKAPERLVMTFGWDGMSGKVVVNVMTLHDLGDGRTKLMTTMQFESAADRDGMAKSGMEKGMNQSYAALDKVLAQ
jgi:uncharacterized protein YndB with AHSA1/START domain